MSPFRAVYGREPPTLLRWETGESKVDEVDKYLKERNKILQELKTNLIKAQERMKKAADTGRRDVQYQVGDEVFLRMQPYRFRKLAKRPNEKLSQRFYGPYPILEKIGAVAYKILLPPDSKIHPVFHVSQLKKVVGPSIQPQPLPECLTDDWELQLQPEELLDFRYSATGVLEVLIKWRALPECENSWEDYFDINSQYPEFHLEDKVKLKGGSVDKPLVNRVYIRRKLRRSSGMV